MFGLTRPKYWIELGGFSLALVAGVVNAVGLLGFEHQAASHLTGISSIIGVELVNNNHQKVIHLILILASFVIGATFSGIVIPSADLKWGRRYTLAFVVEAFLLALASILLTKGLIFGHFLASAACGLQNGLVTTVSGATIRTTHVSGMFTDIGVMLGGWLRGDSFNYKKFLLFAIIISGFILGGVIGAYSFNYLQYSALFIASSLVLFMAAGYVVLQKKLS